MTLHAAFWTAFGAAGAAFCMAQPGFAQSHLGLGPTQNAGGFRQFAGQPLSFVCPASDDARAKIYGTDTYSDDSAICVAAVHAGVLEPLKAGVVTIVPGGVSKSFRGSVRNGITSRDYASSGYSFTFVSDGKPGSIAWTTVWNGVPEDFTQPIVVRCPEGGRTDRSVWGTDVYTRDSVICVAAVHAGVITPETGGIVTLSRMPGLTEYPGTKRNQVTSQRWGPYNDAFAVKGGSLTTPARLLSTPPPLVLSPPVAPPTSTPPPATPPPATPPPATPPPATPPTGAPPSATPPAADTPPGPPSRTITIAGFTGVGSASQAGPIVSRSIALAGFSGVGSASQPGPIPSRTIQTPGWSGVGSSP